MLLPARLRTSFATVGLALLLASAFAQGPTYPVDLYFFWGDGCPYCHQEQVFLDQLVAQYPDVTVHSFEVWKDVPNRALLEAFSDAFDRPVTGVPVTFVGENAWVGFNQVIAMQITSTVETYLTYDAPDAADRLEADTRAALMPEAP
jgi:thiol-disulfide isomerase/thioredoxin